MDENYISTDKNNISMDNNNTSMDKNNTSTDKNYIIYTRVSTKEQGRDGLSLTSQLDICRDYIKSVGGINLGEFKDVESGRSRNRQGLNDALEYSRIYDATIVFARLSRMARDAEYSHHIINQKYKVHFCDFPNIDSTTFGVMVTLYEAEARNISNQTKAGLDVVKKNIKRNGFHRSKNGNTIVRLGNTKNPRESAEKASEQAAIVHRVNKENSIAWRHSRDMATRLRGDGLTYREIASELNERMYKNSKGGKWSHMGVYKMLN